jgi:hypothetical protein
MGNRCEELGEVRQMCAKNWFKFRRNSRGFRNGSRPYGNLWRIPLFVEFIRLFGEQRPAFSGLQEEAFMERVAGRGKDGSESPGFSSANAGFFGTNLLLESRALASISSTRLLPRKILVRYSSRWCGRPRHEAENARTVPLDVDGRDRHGRRTKTVMNSDMPVASRNESSFTLGGHVG